MPPAERKKIKENLKLKGKVAIVTGAASGIGRAIAIRFAQEGAKVAIFDLNLGGAQKVAQEIGSQAMAIKIDIRDPKQVASGVKKVIEKFGRINILVNNAGVKDPVSLIHPKVKDKWKKVVGTDLTGSFLMAEAVAKQMVQNGWVGSIINITSVHSQVPTPKGSDYIAAKAGLVGATKSWALDLAPHNIRVNAIAPGAIINTGMNKAITPKNGRTRAKKLNIPLGRHGLPEEIAEAAVFLATNEYITGQEIFVDGGFTLTH